MIGPTGFRLTLLLLALALAGCGPAGREAPAGVLRLAWSSDPATLDPARVVDVVGGEAVSLVFEGLVSLDRDGLPAPGLATSWEISDDGLLYRFRIDPLARASDGTSVGPAEVVASFRRLLDPQAASSRSWVLGGIRGAGPFRNGATEELPGLRIVADGTVEIELEKPSASFLGLLSMPNAAVLSTSGDIGGGVATGPWRLVERVRDGHLDFERNPHWHGKPPNFEEIRVRILPEEFTRVAEFEVGNLDVLEVPASESARFRADPERSARLHRQVALVTEYVGLNNEDPVLRVPRVRRALNLAVDVDLILETVLAGRGVRSAGAIPPGLPGGGRGEPYAHDPVEARRLLDEVGLPVDWVLELWQRPAPLASQVLEAVQADLRRIGVTAEIRLRDWGALKASVDRGETMGFFINWYADYPDPENFLVPLFHSENIGGGGNRARYSDAETDRLLARLDRVTDPVERADLAAAIDARVHASAPWIHLWHPIREIAVSARVDGYRPHPVPAGERWLDVRPAGSAGESSP